MVQTNQNDAGCATIKIEDDRTGTSIETLRRAMADHLFYTQGRFPEVATKHDLYMALSFTVRDRLLHRWINTVETYFKEKVRIVCYLSAEFLMGPQLGNNLLSMGLEKQFEEAAERSGILLNDMIDQEEEPGLGNGGLGRLAACYLDSLATLSIPAIGYGIRYEFGIFDQEIVDGWQVEKTDKWLRLGNPWEIARPEAAVEVKIGGRCDIHVDAQGKNVVDWIADHIISGVPYDTPVPGYKTNTANTLRLWKAEAKESFDFQAFNAGDYLGAVNDKVFSENVSKVLYPNDNIAQGKRLRLEQQYFFVACSLQDCVRILKTSGSSIEQFHEKFAFQLNDTHPSIAVPELMRILMDEHQMEWNQAWTIVTNTFAYTNHTLLPEALEKWPVPLFAQVLPRHISIIYEINRRFLDQIRLQYPDDEGMVQRLSLIDDSGTHFVRMANLACVGSHAINGVAALHTELLKQDVLSDFYKLWPEKFSNKTNGITPRRFIALANPDLTALISGKIGDDWLLDLTKLKALEPYADDAGFRREWAKVKRDQKVRLADYIKKKCHVEVDPDSLFDVQAKRMHEYKRQHLNVLHIVHLYNQIKKNPAMKITPRTFLFAGKAAPGYFNAKLVIKLINAVADVVNNDKDVAGRIKVAFIPDFNVTLGQILYPAADLSEQISTAGKEASGTGNMKFALNGALTIGTLDGANIEMLEDIGEENFFLFGLTAAEVQELKASGYRPQEYYERNQPLREVIEMIKNGHFSPDQPNRFRSLVDDLLYHDDYLLFADFDSYVECQSKAALAYSEQSNWTRMSILNVARMGKFSSDRSIREYCKEIWKVEPVQVELEHYQPDGALLKVCFI
ncbi:MAG: glycogen/starch/alpha-glucan phosphorylase [Candidatus Obscuribacterales bacterium]|jgi:starch phosphorylase